LKDGSDLVAGEHDGQAGRTLRSDDVVEPGELLFEDVAIEEENRAQGLVLGRRRDVPVDDESPVICSPRGVSSPAAARQPYRAA
jgi:hypothetical protein